MSDALIVGLFVALAAWMLCITGYLIVRPKGDLGFTGEPGVPGPPGPMGMSGRDCDDRRIDELEKRIGRLESLFWRQKGE